MQQTSAVRSSIASAKRSSGMRPSGSGRTWTTSAPRSSCACAICPTVGNSYSLMTIRFRSPVRSSAETSALTPCETDVVTATSSGAACTRPANAARAASFRSTQNSHSAPFASQPSSHSSAAARTRMRERALRARVRVGRVLEDRELGPNGHARGQARGSDPGDMSLAAKVGLAQLVVLEELRRPCPRARPGRSRARSRGRRSRATRSRSARRRASRRRPRAPAG